MKLIKKIGFLLSAVLIVSTSVPTPVGAQGYKPPFDINSECVYMVNLDTGAVIYEKNADKLTYPASLTKIMTAILAIENIPDLENTMITSPSYIYDELFIAGASNADIRQNETLSALDMLYALLLPSACEAGSAIADYLGGGSIPAFVEMMNAKAKSIGAKNTHFANAHGLHDPGQVTTAYDMYLITQYAQQYPIFEKISNTYRYVMPVTSKHPVEGNWYIFNTNTMINPKSPSYYKGMTAVKTGTLDQVGRNLVTTVSRDGYNYMLVELGAPLYDASGTKLPENLSFTDARNLYDWAFSNFSIQTVLKENEMITEVKVALSDQDYVRLMALDQVDTLLPVDSDSSVVQRAINAPKQLTAPIRKGDVLGKLELRTADETLATVDLVAMDDVERSTWMYAMDVTKRFFGQSSVQLMVGGVIILFLLYLISVARYNIKRKRRAERQRRQPR